MPNFGKATALRDEMTPMLALIALLSSCGAWTFGWDNAWWGGIIGNAYFGQVFGEVATTVNGVTTYTLSATQQSTGTGVGTAGIMVGCMLAGQIAHLGGRRLCFYAVAIISIIGVLIEATAGINGGRYYQMVVGKIFVGISIGVASIAVPLYQAECAPAPIRGALVNFYVTVQALGSWMAYCCLYTLVDGTGKRVWLIPICIQLLAPVLMIAFGWFLPESPRWLVEKGRTEDARHSLMRLRGGKPGGYTPDEDLMALAQAHEDQTSAHGQASWFDCFKGSDLKRTLIVMGVQCLQQGQGLSFLSQYLIVFFEEIGIEQPYLILTIIGGMLTVLTSVGFFTQDFVGRRPLLMGGACIMGASMLALGGLTVKTDISSSESNAAVAMIILYLVAFTQSWTNIPWTVSAELPSNRLRDKTLTIGAWGGYAVGLIITFVQPYLQTAISGGVGFIYGAISVCAVIYIHFLLPELKGITLETVDAMFDAKIPPRKFSTHPMRFQNAATSVEASAAALDSAKHSTEHVEKKVDEKVV